MSINKSILSGIAKDCNNISASIGAEKDLILVNYLDFDKVATFSPFNRQLNDDFGNKGGITDIILKAGAKTYVFEGTDYSVIPSISTEVKEDGNTWFSHSIAFTAYNKTMEARATLLSLGKARVIAITRDRSTGLFELFGAEQGLKMSGLDRAYTGAQSSNFYSITIATPELAVIREKSIGELSLKLNGENGGGSSIPPDQNNLEYLLSLKEDKVNKGNPNGYASLDTNGKVPESQLNIVNDLTTGGISNLLSAEQGKILSDKIELGLDNIRTERFIVLNEPITRLEASEAINNLPSFEIEDNEIPYFVTTNEEGEAGYKVELIGLGKGVYGSGGTAISANQVRIISLIDNGALGLNQILGLGSIGFNKTITLRDSIDTDLETISSKNGFSSKNGLDFSFIGSNEFNFTNTTLFGKSSIKPPQRITNLESFNNLPNLSGTFAISVNGVFADPDGNIELSPTGGEIPSWQKTLNVEVADVIVPYMKVSNNLTESYFALTDPLDDVFAFKVVTPRKILLDSGLNGTIELGKDLGILIDGKDKKVEIKADNTEGILISSGEKGSISFDENIGIIVDARAQGLSFFGRSKGIEIDSGTSFNILGGDMTVNSISEFKEKIKINNSTGLTLVNNSDGFESSIKNENVTNDNLIFQLPNYPTGTYTLATTDDVISQNLNDVLTQGSIGTDKTITLNSISDTDTIFENSFNGFNLTNTVSGVTKKSTLSIESFSYENSSNQRKQLINSNGISSMKTSDNTYSEITPEGLFLKNNTSSSVVNLRANYAGGVSKVLELPNVSGFLTASVNGLVPDQNGNIIISTTGSQNLTQVLNRGNSASSLSIQDVFDLTLLNSLIFSNTTAVSTLKQKTGSIISGTLILPEKTGNNVIPLSVNSVLPNDAGLITLPITNFTNGENLPVTITPSPSGYTPTSASLGGNLQGIDMALINKVSSSNPVFYGSIGMRNIANTFTSYLSNTNTASRSYTFQNKDGVIAHVSDIPNYINPFTFFLDSTNGNDATGAIGDTSKPYATIDAVLNVIASDVTKDYQINIKKGTYTQTVNSPNANIVFYSEALVTLNINANTTLGNMTHTYNMPVSVINLNYGGSANTGFKRKVTCATLSVTNNPNLRIGLLIVRADNLILTNGTLFDSSTSGGAKLDLVCQKITSTGTSTVFVSQSSSVFSIIFDSAVASSGSLTINSGAGQGYVRFKNYTSTSFVNAFSGSSSANVVYDFYDSYINNGGFNHSQAGYNSCIIQGKLTVVNSSGGYMFASFSQFTFLNAYIICDTHLIYRSQALGFFKMVNSYLEISGNFVNNETVSSTFISPVIYVIGMCEIFQTGTPNTFFNFGGASTGMFIKKRGTLLMNNTGLPAGMTVVNDVTNTY